jgi:hypothetical protein
LELSWDCDGGNGNGDGGEGDGLEHSQAVEQVQDRIVPIVNTEEITVTIFANPDQTGSITEQGGIVTLGKVFIGHTGGYPIDFVGYIGFNIEQLIGKEIKSATLKIDAKNEGDPRDAYEKLQLSSIDWGDTNLHSGVKNLFSPFLANFNWDVTQIYYHGDDFNDNLVHRLNDALSDNKKHFQFRIRYLYLNAYSDNENHGISFNASDATLEATYIE